MIQSEKSRRVDRSEERKGGDNLDAMEKESTKDRDMQVSLSR